MKTQNVLILIFILSALTVGSSLSDTDLIIVHESINNATLRLDNIMIGENVSVLLPKL